MKRPSNTSALWAVTSLAPVTPRAGAEGQLHQSPVLDKESLALCPSVPTVRLEWQDLLSQARCGL